MSSEREPIAVIGTGYVGLVTAAGFAELGNEVFCVDIDANKIEGLKRGEVPIYEPGLADSIAANRERIHFSTELAPALEQARLLFVAVGTPPTYSGDADLSAVHAVVDAMPASDHHALVMKSTVPVGTGATIRRTLNERGKSGFSYVSCPEFLKEGSALADFRHPDRVVVGDNGDWAGDAVADLYAPLGTVMVRTDINSAEMIKMAANAFLATKISFINEIANVCEETGADVVEVARGMGLDNRIGDKFLKPGIGFGGSCFAPEETVLARFGGRTTLLRYDQLWNRFAVDHEEIGPGLIEPENLQVLSWVPGANEPQFLPVMCLTRRDYDGDMIDVRTKVGRRLSTTADHPWMVSDGDASEPEIKLAGELSTADWVPLALGRGESAEATSGASLLTAVGTAELSSGQLIVHPRADQIEALVRRPMAERAVIFSRATNVASRTGDVKRNGALRLDEAGRADLSLAGATIKNGNQPAHMLALDRAFWRVAGLYLAEGCTNVEASGRRSIQWSFHPTREQHLVDEVVAYWMRHNVTAAAYRSDTAAIVKASSRILGTWWTEVLGMGRGSSTQRLPDLIWDRPEADRWALLSGLFEGDGSWSLINGGPSVIIELGTISDELADGVLRLLASVGIVAARRVGRVAKSTKDTHWIRIAGADQIERAIVLIPERDRAGALASIARQARRIKPTGYRRFDDDGPAWARIASLERRAYRGPVYSLEVHYSHTVVSTDGIALPQCFPKDVSALKQLAGNSGYHFQLLTAVIEVNELQKRRVIQKLQKHLGSLVGKRVALLGLAFKANTDDMREASSLILAARLQADGALVSAYDPVAQAEASKLMRGVHFADSAMAACRDADAIIIVTEWSEFAELDWGEVAAVTQGTTVIDGRNFIDREKVRAAGFTYEGIGR